MPLANCQPTGLSGVRIPAGSSAAFMCRIMSISTPGRRCASIWRLDCPMPCSAEKLPPARPRHRQSSRQCQLQPPASEVVSLRCRTEVEVKVSITQVSVNDGAGHRCDSRTAFCLARPFDQLGDGHRDIILDRIAGVALTPPDGVAQGPDSQNALPRSWRQSDRSGRPGQARTTSASRMAGSKSAVSEVVAHSTTPRLALRVRRQAG